MKALFFFTLVVALLGLALTALATRDGPKSYPQPIAFSHLRHAEEDLACVDCHTRSAKGPYATLPSIKVCLLCHEEAQGEHPDEPKIREYAEDPGAIPWVQVNRMAGHVYFSHEAHVEYAAMECAECHGDVASLAEPVTTSQIDHLTMGRCMECHKEQRVSNDCLLCHK